MRAYCGNCQHSYGETARPPCPNCGSLKVATDQGSHALKRMPKPLVLGEVLLRLSVQDGDTLVIKGLDESMINDEWSNRLNEELVKAGFPNVHVLIVPLGAQVATLGERAMFKAGWMRVPKSGHKRKEKTGARRESIKSASDK